MPDGVLTAGRKTKSVGVRPCLSLEGLALNLVLFKDGVFSLLEAERFLSCVVTSSLLCLERTSS